MPNNLDGWEEKREVFMSRFIKELINHIENNTGGLTFSGVIRKSLTKLIKDVRKHDMVELIKKIPAFGVIIKDYYEK